MYSVRHTLNEEKLKEKFSEDEKTKIKDASDNVEKWLHDNP